MPNLNMGGKEVALNLGTQSKVYQVGGAQFRSPEPTYSWVGTTAPRKGGRQRRGTDAQSMLESQKYRALGLAGDLKEGVGKWLRKIPKFNTALWERGVFSKCMCTCVMQIKGRNLHYH